MEQEDYDIAQAMKVYGGSFVQALGEAAIRADIFNLHKLKTAFPEYWQQYADMVRLQRMEQRRKD